MGAHTLVIGGTGMLRRAVLKLAEQSTILSVIARSGPRLDELAEQVGMEGGRLNPICVDYADSDRLRTSLAAALSEFGAVDLVVSWIHSSAPDAHRVVARCVDDRAEKFFRWFDLLGSAFADPSVEVSDRAAEFGEFERLQYRSVVLGFVIENSRSRWLTHQEISEGVVRAVENDDYRSVTGQVHPWHRRP